MWQGKLSQLEAYRKCEQNLNRIVIKNVKNVFEYKSIIDLNL